MVLTVDGATANADGDSVTFSLGADGYMLGTTVVATDEIEVSGCC